MVYFYIMNFQIKIYELIYYYQQSYQNKYSASHAFPVFSDRGA